MGEDLTKRLHHEYYQCLKCGHKQSKHVDEYLCDVCGGDVEEKVTWQEHLE